MWTKIGFVLGLTSLPVSGFALLASMDAENVSAELKTQLAAAEVRIDATDEQLQKAMDLMQKWDEPLQSLLDQSELFQERFKKIGESGEWTVRRLTLVDEAGRERAQLQMHEGLPRLVYFDQNETLRTIFNPFGLAFIAVEASMPEVPNP